VAAKLLDRATNAGRQTYDLAGAVGAGGALKVFTVDKSSSVALAFLRLRKRLTGPSDLLMMPEGEGCALLEVTAPGVTKATGVQALADRYGIRMSEVIAVGDNLNDLPLLRVAGHAVAMGNASPEVQQVADVVTDTNDRDGVAAFLEEFVLRVA